MIPRVRSQKHLSFIRELPCCICGNGTTVEAAHIRFTDLRAAKNNPGIGAKPSDTFVCPLCNTHHREQHAYGDEKKWWAQYGIDPIFVSLALWHASGDHEAGLQIIGAAQLKSN
ncbi:MAG TPA: DUF968 domain-containing protein [Bryobacteraceae bacterium]|nr:DUF968 domain-containing protein [Bryobacteraceae bacterium]